MLYELNGHSMTPLQENVMRPIFSIKYSRKNHHHHHCSVRLKCGYKTNKEIRVRKDCIFMDVCLSVCLIITIATLIFNLTISLDMRDRRSYIRFSSPKSGNPIYSSALTKYLVPDNI
jgi:hypothetical protein